MWLGRLGSCLKVLPLLCCRYGGGRPAKASQLLVWAPPHIAVVAGFGAGFEGEGGGGGGEEGRGGFAAACSAAAGARANNPPRLVGQVRVPAADWLCAEPRSRWR